MADPRSGRSRTRQWQALGVGAAGVAVVFGLGPTAQADAPGVPSTPATAPEGPRAPAPATEAKATVSTPKVAANYGYQKYRVGVQIKSGAYVPPGTTTAGTVLTITERGPAVGGTQTHTCTTDASTAEPGSTATFCLVPVTSSPQALRANRAGVPTPPGAPNDELFTAGPGDRITVTQTTVEPNLLLDTTTAKLKRCTITDPNAPPICVDSNGDTLSTDLIFTDPGLPPVAVDDNYSVVQPNSVDIQVLTNDTTHGAPPTVTVDSGPSDGTLTVDPAVGAFTYKPKASFTGTDHYTYTLSTANGSSTAVVTIVVTAAAVTPPPSTPPPLANTGTHAGQLLELGGALLLSGGGALALGRRRQPRRHAL